MAEEVAIEVGSRSGLYRRYRRQIDPEGGRFVFQSIRAIASLAMARENADSSRAAVALDRACLADPSLAAEVRSVVVQTLSDMLRTESAKKVRRGG
jgi:hypothetical protein